MAIIKCKMCGGDIELTTEKTFGTCEFCGSTMTLPKVDDDQRAAAFNRGNHFRRIGEFDKALAVYERIVREDDTDAEAHWCCALCRFGIEYVEDPATYEYLPTCHRASFDSFLEDVDYLAAVEHSEGITKRQYQKDAAKIAEVQRGILATSQNAEPYDVFICYKESDENGERTRDSLMAQDIYYQLTEQGRKVFFARITLEDVAGTQYEPYIFAALNSAKVMIVVGTKPEYLNAVWVKNEWSRFLAMMKKDRHKLLLPCYRDMDPYDMPEALSVLQSYDMGKIGFIQDLTRGIAKVIDADKKPVLTQETIVVQQTSGTNIAPLLKRAFMFLEDGEWNSANEYCEKVLDVDPENAQAYLGKLLAEMGLKKHESLKDLAQPFDHRNNYQKAVRFADEELRNTLTGYISHIKERNENNRRDSIYAKAIKQKNAACDQQGYLSAAALFKEILDWKDAAKQAEYCCEKAEEERKNAVYDQAKHLMDSNDEAMIRRAAPIFKTIAGWRDADELANKCPELANVVWKNTIYNTAETLANSGTISALVEAIYKLKIIPEWRDSKQKIIQFEKQLEELREKARLEETEKKRLEEEVKAKAEAERVEREHQRRIEEKAAADKEKKRKMVIKLCSIASVVVIIAVIILTTVVVPGNHYSTAVSFESAGDYENALIYYQKAGSYKDSQDKLREVSVLNAQNFTLNDKVYLGNYNGELLEWIVISVDGHHAVLVCNSIIENKQYNDMHGGIDVDEESFHYNEWPNCSLRTWLNTDFLNAAFNDSEMSVLTKATVVSAGEYKTEATVTDYVYILSGSEMNDAAKTNWDVDCSIRNEALWLRGSSGTNGSYAQGYNTDVKYDLNRLTMQFGVVPVIWLDIH